jgi:UDP-N-acetylmuramate--alanine ligase
MSALAVALKRLGDEVSGSERTLDSDNVRRLRSLGIDVSPDDGSAIDGSIGEIIVSTAVESSHPAFGKAAQLGIPVTHRAKALAAALSGRDLVAVVGTCGKSTVTAMLSHILAENGLDPFCVNGANVPGWEGAVRFGRGRYAVAEVDESDRSLVQFKPYAAIITNSSADHYSKEEMDEVFDAFVKSMPGPLVDAREGAADHDAVEELAGRESLGRALAMPGCHNRLNAALAVIMAGKLGVGEAAAIASLGSFRGVERRLQRYGERVYDDYAHNPEKLKALWTTLAEAYPRGVCVIWRPHGYGPLAKMMEALAQAFNESVREQDKLLLLPVYDAGGTADRSVSTADLFGLVDRGKAVMVDSHRAALEWCESRRAEFGAFATCGARDPRLPALAAELSEAVGS